MNFDNECFALVNDFRGFGFTLEQRLHITAILAYNKYLFNMQQKQIQELNQNVTNLTNKVTKLLEQVELKELDTSKRFKSE